MFFPPCATNSSKMGKNHVTKDPNMSIQSCASDPWIPKNVWRSPAPFIMLLAPEETATTSRLHRNWCLSIQAYQQINKYPSSPSHQPSPTLIPSQLLPTLTPLSTLLIRLTQMPHTYPLSVPGFVEGSLRRSSPARWLAGEAGGKPP